MKRAAASNDAQSSAGSHCAGNAHKHARFMKSKAKSKAKSEDSSGSSHCAGNAPKRVRINTHQCKSQHSSDGIHFTGKVGLLFAEGEKMAARLRQQLAIDNRPSLRSNEVLMFVDEFDLDIAIVANCEPIEFENFKIITSGDTTWQVWCNPKSWKISQLEMIDLIPGWRHAVLMTLQRSTSCGETLRVVAIKTLKGIPHKPLFFSAAQRRNVATAIFKLLSEASCLTLVLGNIGFALASCYTHLCEYRRKTGEDLNQDLQILASDSQELMSLFIDPYKPITGAQSLLIEAETPERVIMVRLSADRSAPVHTVQDTDADNHVHEPIPCKLTPRIEHFLKLLQTPSCENLANILLFPVVQKRRLSHGVQEVGPVHFSSTLQMLEDALLLVQQARRHAGFDRMGTVLSTSGFQKASDFLRDTFEVNIMNNEQLKANIRVLVEDPDNLSRKMKRYVKRKRRDAFKAFKFRLIGNVHFLHAVMRHGIFNLTDQQQLAAALLQEQRASEEHDADNVGAAVQPTTSKETLRAEAVHARQQVKKAQKLVNASSSGAQLTQSEKALCTQFENGTLEQVRNQKDRAYGHGKSVTSVTIEQAAVLRAFSFNQLEQYFK